MWWFIGGVFVGVMIGFIGFAILAAGRMADERMLKHGALEGEMVFMCPHCKEEISLTL